MQTVQEGWLNTVPFRMRQERRKAGRLLGMVLVISWASSCASFRDDVKEGTHRPTDLFYPRSWLKSEEFGTRRTDGTLMPSIYRGYFASGDELLTIAMWYCERLYSEGWERFACLDESIGYPFPVWGGIFSRDDCLARVTVCGPLIGEVFLGSADGSVVDHRVDLEVLRGDGVLLDNRPSTSISHAVMESMIESYRVATNFTDIPDVGIGREEELFYRPLREYEEQQQRDIANKRADSWSQVRTLEIERTRCSRRGEEGVIGGATRQ